MKQSSNVTVAGSSECYAGYNGLDIYILQITQPAARASAWKNVSGRLKKEWQGLEAALIYFNKLSMFLYLPSILPGQVFIDPQMSLGSINRIVTHSYQVGCGAVLGLAVSESRLWK